MALETLIVDLDGVLTDGRQYIGPDGEKMMKSFHSRDIRAIKGFLNAGVRVIVWSADDWPGGRKWCERVGCEWVYARDKLEKLQELEYVNPETTLIVGDDAWDVPAMKAVKWAAAPHDADPVVHKSVAGLIDLMYTNGGCGVIAALLAELMESGLKITKEV